MVQTSPDGITWTARTPSSSAAWEAIVWCPEIGEFIVASFAAIATTNNIMTSRDGITWTARTQGTASNLLAGCWSPQLAIAVLVGPTVTAGLSTSKYVKRFICPVYP